MSELPPGVAPARPARPRDSASGIVLCGDGEGGWRVLLGRRSRRSRFMPGAAAFPGGAADAEDRPDEPGGYARCATRELREETGLELAPERWLEAGLRLTPPMFPVRFRNRFFVAAVADGAPAPAPATTEFERLDFVDPQHVLAEWEEGRSSLPPPLLPILRALGRSRGLPPRSIAARVAEANRREERAARIEFAPGIWMLPLRTPTMPPATHTNVWLPGGRSRFAIVDPGSSDVAEIERLLGVVQRRCALGQRPAAVLLTHHHRDHVGGATPIARELELPLRGHPAVLERLCPAADLRVEPLTGGDTLDLDGASLRALDTPGHARGHLAFDLPERDAVVVGDLISGISTILIDPDEGDMAAYLESVERVRELGRRTLLPGHGPPLPGKALGRLLEHRRARESAILAHCRGGPLELPVIARAAYAETPDLPAALIERQTLSHLIDLERRGRVRRAPGVRAQWTAS